MHSIGCIYNDLKLDNICVGYPDESEINVLKMIDFGLATSYVIKDNLFKEPLEDKSHIKETTQDFQGNVAFCSPFSLKCKSTSRRDDLYSILYLMLYLNTNKIPFMDYSLPVDERKK